MILVTGSILARPDSLDQVLAMSLDHVRRSRAEPGCVSHAVHQDVENPLRLVFVERWADRVSLMAHFGVPDSRAFARAAGALSAQPPTVEVYEAQPLEL